MFFCFNVKKTALLSFLLMQAMTVQALEAPEAAAETVATDAKKEQQRGYSFPRWPDRKQVHREVIPPAPPGPYMSSALNRFSTAGTAFSRGKNMPNKNKPAIRMNPSNMSMQEFSPDIAWPNYQNSPNRWKPEDGYRFVEPSANMPHQMMPFRGSSSPYVYKQRPESYRPAPQLAPPMRPAYQSRSPSSRSPAYRVPSPAPARP